MAKFETIQVDIMIEQGSDLYNRLCRIADAEDIRFEEAVYRSVSWGVYHHMGRNLDLMERGLQNRCNA